MAKKMSRYLGLCIIVVLVAGAMLGCSGAKREEKKVVVASKPFAESYILAEMIRAVIENDTDINVEMKTGIAGGTSNIQPAMEKGEIDLYPEYTGTGWLFVLKQDLVADPEDLYKKTQQMYMDQYNIKWLGRYGFNNTYTLAIKKDLAEEKGIETFSDLAKISDQLTFGAEYDFFERDDGYKSLSETYGLNFKATKEMDIGLKYQAIGADEVQVINAFSTDGLLKEYDLKVLKDDKLFFPDYHGATLIRQAVLDQYPELEKTLGKLNGIVSDQEMVDLNYQVEKENKDPKEVADKYLREKGLIL